MCDGISDGDRGASGPIAAVIARLTCSARACDRPLMWTARGSTLLVGPATAESGGGGLKRRLKVSSPWHGFTLRRLRSSSRPSVSGPQYRHSTRWCVSEREQWGGDPHRGLGGGQPCSPCGRGRRAGSGAALEAAKPFSTLIGRGAPEEGPGGDFGERMRPAFAFVRPKMMRRIGMRWPRREFRRTWRVAFLYPCDRWAGCETPSSRRRRSQNPITFTKVDRRRSPRRVGRISHRPGR